MALLRLFGASAVVLLTAVACANNAGSAGATQPAAAMGGSIAFAPPAVGTRFITPTGYFQITQVSGMSVVTVNNANRSASWYAGFFYIGNQVDPRSVEAVWPLQAGKTITFDERAGSDGWHHTVTVVRLEDLTTPAGVFPTVVVEERIQSLSAAQANLDVTKTYWYAPSVRWILKRDFTQKSGPPYSSERFTISQIVQP